MTNLVEIIISGKNLAGPAIAESKAQASGLGGAFTTAAVVAGAGAALIIAKSVSMASQFQSTMEMLHTQAGVPQAAIASLSQGVLGLAGAVGFAPNNLAEALYHVESSFASMPGQLDAAGGAMNILKVAAEGAAVGHSNLVDTTNALDAAIAAGIPGVQNMDQAMGALNATVGSGDMHMQDLAQAFGTGMVAVVKGYGLSIQDVGAALAVFGDNNIRGAQAGTNLRMAVQALAVPAKAGAAELQHLGMTTTQLAQDMQKGGLLPALEDIKKHMEAAGLSATQQGTVITEIFGKKAGTGVAILLGQLDRVQSKYPEIQKAMAGFAGAVAANNDTMAQKTKDARAAFDALMIELGQLLLPVVTRLMGAFGQFTGFLVKHKDAAAALAIVLGGAVLAAIGLVTVALWNMAAATLAAAWPMLVIIGVAALLAVAAYEIISHWKNISGFFKDVWNAVVGFFKDAARDVMDALHWVEDLPGNIVKWLGDLAGMLGHLASEAWDAFTHGLTAAWRGTLNFLKNLPHEIGYALGWLAGTLSRLAVDGWNAFTHGITTAWKDTVQWFKDLPKRIGEFFSDGQAWLNTPGMKVIRGLGDGISSAFKAVVQWFKDLPHNIISAFSDADNWLHTPGVTVIKGLWNGIVDGAKAVWDWLKNLPRNIGSFFSDVGKWLVNAGKDLVMGLIHGIESAFGAVMHAVGNFASGVIDGFKSAFGSHSPATTMMPIGESLMTGVAKGIDDNVHHAIAAAGRAVGKVVGAFAGNASLGLSVSGSGSLGAMSAGAPRTAFEGGSGDGGGWGGTLTFAGTQSAFSTFVMNEFRAGRIQLVDGNGKRIKVG